MSFLDTPSQALSVVHQDYQHCTLKKLTTRTVPDRERLLLALGTSWREFPSRSSLRLTLRAALLPGTPPQPEVTLSLQIFRCPVRLWPPEAPPPLRPTCVSAAPRPRSAGCRHAALSSRHSRITTARSSAAASAPTIDASAAQRTPAETSRTAAPPTASHGRTRVSSSPARPVRQASFGKDS